MENEQKKMLDSNLKTRIENLRRTSEKKRESIEFAVQQYLENGGKIDILPPQVIKDTRNVKAIKPGDSLCV